MKQAVRQFIYQTIPNADQSELAQRYFMAPDNLNRFLWARDFNLPKALDMY
jgi:hypothetical protein